MRLIILCPALLALTPHSGSAGTVDPGAPGSAAGVYSSLAMVGGRPAIVYSNGGSPGVKFVRALDAAGNQWGVPVVIDARPGTGGKVCLELVNGFPAVCYFEGTQQRLKYARATDAAGGSWAAPVVVDPASVQAPGYALAEVAGRPAVCVERGGSGGLLFLRAANVEGTLWGSPVTLETAGSGFEPSLELVAGNPAVAYFAEGTLRYARASEGAGTVWAPAELAGEAAPAATHGISLAVVSGRPAVTYINSGELMYNRAGDEAGAAWGIPFSPNSVTIPDFQIRDVQSSTLAFVAGRPVIGYYTTLRGDLSFMQANDGEGGSRMAWGPPLTVDSIHNTGKAPVLVDAGGLPAFSYHDVTAGSLEFLRAIPGDGSYHWRTEIQVKTQDFVPIPVNGSLQCQAAVPGFPQTTGILIANPNSGSGSLKDFVFTLDGPDAAEFMFIGPAPGIVDPGSVAAAYVVYQPVTPGVKHAVLHIASNADSPAGLYDINLTAQSLPSLQVEFPFGSIVPDGGSLSFPVPVPGDPADIVVTLRNTGFAPLENLAFSVDGPHAAEFFLSSSQPAEPIAPGETVTVVLRHIRSAAGGRTAALHIVSNSGGGQNVYDLNLSSLPGKPDISFHSATGDILALAVQGDGRIITGGLNFVARLLPDGSRDPEFTAPAISGEVRCIAVQKDRRILLSGTLDTAGGYGRLGVVRLLPDGSVDTSFYFQQSVYPQNVSSLAVLSDGKILAGGALLGPVEERIFQRLHPDGSKDESFNPAGPGRTVSCLGITSKGWIFAGGRSATSYPDFRNYEFLQLSADGMQQGATLRLGSAPACAAELADGSILFEGDTLVRLMPGGASIPVQVVSGTTTALAPQADGRCVLAGQFYQIPAMGSHLARMRGDGSPDPDFHATSSTPVWDAVLQADGKVLIAGTPAQAGDTQFTRLSRLENDPAYSRLKAVNGSAVHWLRGGSAPEVRDVTFDVKAAGAAGWTRLGNAQRIPGGWGLSGLTLPASGLLRAQGYAGGSVIEATAPVVTPLEAWRRSYFGSSENAGPAADDNDPDGDGLTNFAEFAFGLHPLERAGSVLPEFRHSGGFFEASFTPPDGRSDILYTAEWSPDLKAGKWLPVPQTGNAPGVVFRVPADGKSAFVRYVIQVR